MIVVPDNGNEPIFFCEDMDILECLNRIVTAVKYITEVHYRVDAAEMIGK
jgi:hypothetical protein